MIFDNQPDIAVALKVPWVDAKLHHNPSTRHLEVTVSVDGDKIVLSGRVPTVQDRERAGSVAVAAIGGWREQLDNQLGVEGDIEVDQSVAA